MEKGGLRPKCDEKSRQQQKQIIFGKFKNQF